MRQRAVRKHVGLDFFEALILASWAKRRFIIMCYRNGHTEASTLYCSTYVHMHPNKRNTAKLNTRNVPETSLRLVLW